MALALHSIAERAEEVEEEPDVGGDGGGGGGGGETPDGDAAGAGAGAGEGGGVDAPDGGVAHDGGDDGDDGLDDGGGDDGDGGLSDEYYEVPWDCLDVLVRGDSLLKFGRQGEPHFRQFSVDPTCAYIEWLTSKKKTAESRVLLANCGLVEGQGTDVFRRQPRPDLVDLSFSLMYEDPKRKGVSRTLDVVCKDRREYETWVTGLQYLIQGPPPAALLEVRMRLVWADMLRKAASEGGGPGSPLPAISSPLAVTAASGALPLTARDAESRRAATSKNLSKDLKNRIKDRNDVYAWGSNAWGECGVDDEVARAAPTILSVLLGHVVRTIACGSQHVLALAATGECYAWGNGACGRLGTGGVDCEKKPRQLLKMPVSHGTGGGSHAPGTGGSGGGGSGAAREPYLFRAVACGDMHSLAIDADGVAYTWGAGAYGQLGHGDHDDRLVPTPVQLAVFATVASQPQTPSSVSGAASRSFTAAWGDVASPGALPHSIMTPRASAPAGLAAATTPSDGLAGLTSPGAFSFTAPGAAGGASPPPVARGDSFRTGRTSIAPGGSGSGSGGAASRLDWDGTGQLRCFQPAFIAVAGGCSYSAFIDGAGRLYTCGIDDAPLAHDLPLLARVFSSNCGSCITAVSLPTADADHGEAIGGVGEGAAALPAVGDLATRAMRDYLLFPRAASIAMPSPAVSRATSNRSTRANSHEGAAAGEASKPAAPDGAGSTAAEPAAAAWLSRPAAAATAVSSVDGDGGPITFTPVPPRRRPVQLSVHTHDGGSGPAIASLAPDVAARPAEAASRTALTTAAAPRPADTPAPPPTSLPPAPRTCGAGSCTLPLQVVSGWDITREQAVGLSCGAFHMGVVTTLGNCWMWGFNATGALGVGDTTDRLLPVRLASLPRDAVALACGTSHTLALVDDRTTLTRHLFAWGSCVSGQVPATATVTGPSNDLPEDPTALPFATDTPAYCLLPRLIELPVPVTAAGSAAAPAATADGIDASGTALPMSPAPGMGPADGTPGSPAALAAASAAATIPAPAKRPLPRAIAAGAFHSAVITDDGALYTFGDGGSGQLGLQQSHIVEAWKRVRKNRLVDSTVPRSTTVSLARRTLKSGLDRIRTLGTMRSSVTPATAAAAAVLAGGGASMAAKGPMATPAAGVSRRGTTHGGMLLSPPSAPALLGGGGVGGDAGFAMANGGTSFIEGDLLPIADAIPVTETMVGGPAGTAGATMSPASPDGAIALISPLSARSLPAGAGTDALSPFGGGGGSASMLRSPSTPSIAAAAAGMGGGGPPARATSAFSAAYASVPTIAQVVFGLAPMAAAQPSMTAGGVTNALADASLETPAAAVAPLASGVFPIAVAHVHANHTLDHPTPMHLQHPELSDVAPLSVVAASVYFPSQCDDFAAGVFRFDVGEDEDDVGDVGDDGGDGDDAVRGGSASSGSRIARGRGPASSPVMRVAAATGSSEAVALTPAPTTGGAAPAPAPAAVVDPHPIIFAVPTRDLDIRRSPSPPRIAEYRSGTYGLPPHDDIVTIMQTRGRSHVVGALASAGGAGAGGDGDGGRSAGAVAVVPGLGAAAAITAGAGAGAGSGGLAGDAGDVLANVKAIGLVGAGAASVVPLTGVGAGLAGPGGVFDAALLAAGGAAGAAVVAMPGATTVTIAGAPGAAPVTRLLHQLTPLQQAFVRPVSASSDAPLPNTLRFGPLPVVALGRREVRSIACGMGFTICTAATEWLKDEEAPNCMRCDQPFTVLRRRHHCRNCYGIFCENCTRHRRPLLKLGHITPVRVCDGCFLKLQLE